MKSDPGDSPVVRRRMIDALHDGRDPAEELPDESGDKDDNDLDLEPEAGDDDDRDLESDADPRA